MKTFFKANATFAILAAVTISCTKQEMGVDFRQANRTPIEFSASSKALTRSAIYGPGMPMDRDLHVSAYFNGSTTGDVSSAESKNYFVGEVFSHSASNGTWRSFRDGALCWPLSGSLDFLAYSTEQSGLTEKWDANDCSGKLALSGFNPELSHSDDVLFAAVNGEKPTSVAVPMQFKHSKALIVFTARASYADAVIITSIKVKDVQPVESGTILTVTNVRTPASSLAAVWSGLGAKADVSVPGLSPTAAYFVPKKAINTTVKSGFFGIGGEGILVAPQGVTSFEITYAQKGDAEAVTRNFTYDCTVGVAPGTQWEAGKRYIYELYFDVSEVAVSATVEQWDTADESTSKVDL